MIDVYQLAIDRFHDMPEGWQWCSIDKSNAPPDHMKVEGAVPIGVFKSGPRKGMPKFPHEVQTIWLTRSQTEAAAVQWEQETGKCHKCEGEGKEAATVSVRHGNTYRDCSRCKGTGAAQ